MTLPRVLPVGSLTLLDASEGEFAFYVWNNVTIMIWTSQATGDLVGRLAA
jgi:hypothetical protein